MKIMFCLGSLGKGGAERVATTLSNKLIKNNKIDIVVTSSDVSAYNLDKRIQVHVLDNKDTKSSNIIIRTLKRTSRLKKIIKTINPDLIISFLPEPTTRVLMANFFNDRKIIVSVRNDPKIEYNTFIKKVIMRILFYRATGFVFQTKEAQNFFSRKIQRRSVVISNPIDQQFICKPFEGTRNNHIVTVGRLTPQKNHKVLIEAFNEVQKKNNCELYIYGEGSLMNDLKLLCLKLNISEKVHFEGNVNDVKAAIYDSKMFVLSSDYEGMPNALMEAMALGLPCISTDCPCGGPSFLMKGKENGILVPVNDVRTLKKAMELLLNDSKTAELMGNRANMIGKELSIDKIYKQWEKYISLIIKD